MVNKILFLTLLLLAKTCYIVLAENKPYSSLPIHLKYNDVSNADKPLLKKGFIDVTKAPYNAKGDNSTDDTQAIQAALIDAYTYNFVAYLPGDKTYLVSQQLDCATHTVERRYGYQIVGSTVGAKPVIRLANYAATSFLAPKKILFLFELANASTGKTDPANNYSAFFRGIDINMGVGNSTISALSMDGAQYCSIEDVKVTGDFYAGVFKLPGSGGYVVNLEVIGGQIGILQDAYRPTPTVIGLKLENQAQYGIRMTNARGQLVVSGFQIKSPASPSSAYRAISINSTLSGGLNGVVDHGYANLCLTDGSIEVSGSTGLAIDNYAQDVTLNNVYVKAATIVNSGAGAGSTLKTVAGNTSNWNKITNYIFTSKLDKSTVVSKLINLNDRTQNYQKYDPLILETPTADFLRMHSWTKLPSWEDKKADGTTSKVVDVTEGITVGGTLYRATTGDQNGTDDDGIALQKIIDEVTNPASPYAGMIVFLPRGYYQIKKTLILNSGLVLIGAGKSISHIEPYNDWLNTPTTRAIVLESQNVVSGNLFLMDFGVLNYSHTQALHIQTPNTVIIDLLSEHVEKGQTFYWSQSVKNPPTVPYILFSNNAGVKIYNLVLGGAHSDIDAASRVYDPTGQTMNYYCGTDYVVPVNNYHMLKIENNVNPIIFYHFNVERLLNSPQVKFINAKNITMHGFKYEYNYELLEINNSDNVKIYGSSGNYQLNYAPDRALIVILNSTNIVLENLNHTEFFIPTPPMTSNWLYHDSNLITGDYGILHYDNYGAETGISNTTFKNINVVITPNPTNDFINVAINDYTDFAGSQLKIQNSMGQQVFNKEIVSNKTQVDSKVWGVSGIYFLSVLTKNGELIESKKIIKH